MKKTDFNKLRRGTKVWCYTMNMWGVIKNTNATNDTDYPIMVTFDVHVSSRFRELTFTSDGKYEIKDNNPALFLDSFDIPENAYISPNPMPKLELGMVVDTCQGYYLISDIGDEYYTGISIYNNTMYLTTLSSLSQYIKEIRMSNINNNTNINETSFSRMEQIWKKEK